MDDKELRIELIKLPNNNEIKQLEHEEVEYEHLSELVSKLISKMSTKELITE